VAEPTCEGCHTLSAAGFEGTIGPDLDDMRPGYATVLDALRTGPGAMPDYSDQFDARGLHDIAAYVSGAAAAGGER
jgi:mono/diheme cytochrome c family protein